MGDNVYLATTAQVTTESSNQSTAVFDVAKLLEDIAWASARVMTDKDCPFEPNIETRYFDASMGQHMSNDRRTLWLRYPLLSLTSAELGDSTALTAGQYTLRYGNDTPYFAIQLNQSSGYAWTQYTTNTENAISITGVWGYRHKYSQAWVLGSTLNGAIANSTVTSITVTSGTPFSPGMLLKIENEWLRLTAVSTNTLTVERGVNGSTAAAHNTALDIHYWTVEPIVNRAVVKWASYLLSRRGAHSTVTYDGLGTEEYPPDAPEEVSNILKSFYNSQGFRAVG